MNFERMILSVASRVFAKTRAQQILQKFPIRYDVWEYDPKSDAFVTEMSSLRVTKDPWNRPVAMSSWKIHKDEEGDVTHVEGRVTVQGMPVNLVVLND